MTLSTPDIERLKGLLEKAIANWDALSPLSTRSSFVLAGSELAENIRVALPALLSDRADLEAEVERLKEPDERFRAMFQLDVERGEAVAQAERRAQAAEAENARLKTRIAELVDDLERRGSDCYALAEGHHPRPQAKARCAGKGAAYNHGAELARALLHEGEK